MSENIIPYISKPNVKAALEKSESLRLISNKANGWRANQESVTTGNEFSSYGVVQFHKQMMSLGTESLDRFGAEEREVSSVTVTLSEKTFSKVQKMVEEFRSQIVAIAEEEKQKDRVYQVNFQIFPLSKKRNAK